MELLVVFLGEVTGGCADGVSWMVGIGVGQGGVVIGTLCGDTAGEAVCGVWGSRTSVRQRIVDCALVHTLRDSVTLGSRMCRAHL